MSSLDAFKADIPGVETIDDPRIVAAKSKDFFWYSPILKALLDDKVGELVVRPKTEAEVIRVAAACARHRIKLTVRGGGTGNYGQCVPLEGGVILDITGLNRVVKVEKGHVTCEAGILIADLEKAVRADPVVSGGQEILMFPSTRDIATIGGFIAGGYAGAGTVRNGILKDTGNVTLIRVVTLEETPRIIELKDADIQKVHHAYGTNGIITQLKLTLKPAVDWVHHIALFQSYGDALRFGTAASEAGGQSGEAHIDAFLITAAERRFAPYYEEDFGQRFPPDRDAVFAMVNPAHLARWRALVQQFGGAESMAHTESELAANRLPPAFECAYNHTTLMALKVDKSWTNLQTVYPWPIDVALVEAQMARWGEEVLMHHEFGKQFGAYVGFGLPLVSYFDSERLYEIVAEFEADGCQVFDNHVVTIEDGGMKTIDTAQIDFKRIADPHGLMNPGKTRGWTPAMARP